jgi:tetratricopeptide (TPR) repeat protein
VVVVLAIGLILGSCSPKSSTNDDMVVIKTGGDFGARQQELQKLTEATLIKYVEGKPLTQQDIDNLEKAKPIARGMIAFDASRYTSHLVLGQIQLALGERDDALRSMLQCILIAPSPEKRGEADNFIIAETANDIANIYYGKNQFDEAESFVREALKISPENIKYLGNLTQILVAAGRVEEAKKELEKIRKIKPDSETLAALELLVKSPTSSSAPNK